MLLSRLYWRSPIFLGGATPHWKWHHDWTVEVHVLSWRYLRCAAKALSTAVDRTGIEIQSYLEGYRRGDCLSRMGVGAQRGTTSASESGCWQPFRGSRFSRKRLLPTAFGKLGDRKPEGRSACAGVACAMSERKDSRSCLGAYNDRRPGDSTVFFDRAAAG